MRLFLAILLAFSVSTLMANGNDTPVEKEAKKEAKEQALDAEKKGQPSDPGAKGQANAAYKKANNPGKGSGKNKSLEVTPLKDGLEEDRENENGNKKNDKNNK